jgi:hypothetical protein
MSDVKSPTPTPTPRATTGWARKLTLSRRACLRGLGASLALPWLEAMQARPARAAGPKPLRFLTVFAPHGMHMPGWTPKQTGAEYTLPPILSPLAALRGELSVVSGLANYPASITTKEFAGSHARGTGALLTQTPLRFTASKDIQNGISLDQVIANQLKAFTRLPSLEVGVSAGSATGNCEDGYSCAYLHNISWSGPTTFMPKEVNPRALWNRLFGGAAGPGPRPANPPAASGPAAAAGPLAGAPDKQVIYRKGVLDVVRGDVTRLNGRLGRRDRAKLDEYLTSVGELQRRIVDFETPAGSGPQPLAACTPGTAPAEGSPGSYEQHLKLLSDLIVLAFQCDVTRVATFMQEDPFNSRSFSFLGVSGNHHSISHHGGDSAKQASLQKIDTFEVTQFAYLLNKMAQVQNADGDGQSLLHNSIVLFTSDFGDGDDHYHWDLPMLVAGRAGGRWKPGRHIAYPHRGSGGPSNKTDTPMANLFLSILQAFDMPASTFGTDGSQPYGTKALAELTG